MAQNQQTRARRALAIKPASDENVIASQRASFSATVNKLTGGANSNAGSLRLGKDLGGKAGQAVTTTRRALGDVNSNANKAKVIDRDSKDTAALKSRSRPASQSSVTSVASQNTRVVASKAHAKSLSAANGRTTIITRSSTASLRDDSRLRAASDNGINVSKAVQQHWDDALNEVSEEGQQEVLARPHHGSGVEWNKQMDISEQSHEEKQVRSSQQSVQIEDDSDEDAVMQGDDLSVLSDSASASQASADPDNWLLIDPSEEIEARRVIAEIQQEFQDELDYYDATMVAEYSEEIFAYMATLEEKTMPSPNYMSSQTELDWNTRTTLIEWLQQIHMRYHLLPETLFITVNVIDRFLSKRVVSLVKLQLVGITAIFLAAKYEEIMAPSVEEFVALTDNGYSKEEILKGERIVLATLDFNISPYCSPYSWVRKISRADDYDIQSRTLCKLLLEVALLDHRFLRAKPSLIAATGMYLARRMLSGDWNEAFIFYSGFAEQQLHTPAMFLIEDILDAEFERRFVYKKYSTRKFLKASVFAVNWARSQKGS